MRPLFRGILEFRSPTCIGFRLPWLHPKGHLKVASIPHVAPLVPRRQSSTKIRAPRRHRKLLTLDPARFKSSGQPILDTSNATLAKVHLSGRGKRAWCIAYFESGAIRFPPHAQGLLYYHHPGEIRFRLCQTVDEFDHGSDLEFPNGETWRLSLRHALHQLSEPDRRRIIDLLPDRSLSLSNWHVNPARRVVTLSPKEIARQQIFDLSGAKYAGLYTGASGDYSRLSYFHQKAPEDKFIPFPDGSRGVFYYRQSRTAPTQVGELRFRLCDSVQLFEQGTDLLLPSGGIWHVSSDSLLLVAEYRNLRTFLAEAGLLDCRLYSNELCKSAVATSRMLPHLLSSSQPFVLNLHQKRHSLRLWTGSSFEQSTTFELCPQRRKQAFRGRALVRLEQPPQSLLDLEATAKTRGHPPLFVIRVLEMLTPLERNPDWTDSDTEHTSSPTVGELYMRRKKGKYVPWLIRGHREDWPGFIPALPDTAK